MLFSSETALRWIEILVALSCILQVLELIQIQHSWSEKGIWRWSDLKTEFQGFPFILQKVFEFLLSERNFLFLLYSQILFAALLFISPHFVWTLILLINSVLVCVRWRGTFNGGSDYMTVLTLSMALLMRLFPHSPSLFQGAMWYLAIQSILSYFIAGFVKLKNPQWRHGQALSQILQFSHYNIPIEIQKLSSKKWMMVLGSWIVIVIECLSPLSLLSPKICFLFLISAFLFHVMNSFVFGLNRFVFAWLASYPAIYYCSSLIN